MTKETNLDKAVRITMESVVQEIKTTDKFAKLKDYIGKYVAVPLADIRIEENVRQSANTNSSKFAELVDSIKDYGLLQNPVVELRFEGGKHQLYCIAGQRRILAALRADLKTATCLIHEYTDAADRISSGLVENLMREDLFSLDIADGYAKLAAAGWTEEMIADRFDRDKRTIHRYLKMAAWPEEVKQLIRQHPERFTSKVLFLEFVSRKFKSYLDLKKAVEAKIAGKTKPAKEEKSSLVIKQAQTKLQSKYATKVEVKGNDQKGQFILRYQSQEEFERLLSLLTI